MSGSSRARTSTNSSLASGTTSLPEGLFSKGVICQASLRSPRTEAIFVVLVFAALVSPDQVNFKADEAHSRSWQPSRK